MTLKQGTRTEPFAVEAGGGGTAVVDRILQRTREMMRAEVVYGEPIEREGTVVIPAAKVTGGGGGGGDAEQNGGGGFGLRARPVGAWIIRGEGVEWRPSIDVNRAILGGQILAIVALLALRSILKARFAALAGRR